MKYILFLILTFPIFAETYEETEFAKEKKDNPTKTTEPEKESSQPNTEPKDNTNLTQAEIRKKRKLEIGIGYGEGNDKFSETPGFLNLNLEYNLTSRFSVGYSHLHKQRFSTSPYLNPFLNLSILEKTNSLEVGLLNFRYYFFEKFPLYITGGMGRDYVSHYKSVEYQYAKRYEDGTSVNIPVIREVNSPLANYKFYGLGFQWVFQKGFFIGVEQLMLHTSYEYQYKFLILNKNYTTEGILLQPLFFSDYQETIKTNLSTIRLGYSLQF
ncbi:MAG: hypothetical protein IPO06_11775 [Leptospiraceae bacterium]|nr:hypothetical protein [Leptospiraceae bacterium]